MDGNEFGGYGNSKYDGKSPQYRDHQFGAFMSEKLPDTALKKTVLHTLQQYPYSSGNTTPEYLL